MQFTGGTMTAHFWGSDLPCLAIGETLNVQLMGLSTELPAVPASPIERSELPGGRSYRLGYTLTPEFQSRIPVALQGLFPFRASHRVKPSEGNPAVVRLSQVDDPSGREFPGQVVDLSSGGIGLVVSREVEAAFHGQTEIHVGLEFPALGENVRANRHASVQHRRLRDGMVFYGMKFAADSRGTSRDQQTLDAYLLDREREGS